VEQLRIEPLSGEHGLRIAGDLDHAASEEFDRALSLLAVGGGDVVLDLGGVSFIDSEGLRVLARAAMTLGGSRTLVLTHPSPSVTRLLDLTGVEKSLSNLRVRALDPRAVPRG
jgi:anti-anti-sigma factor